MGKFIAENINTLLLLIIAMALGAIAFRLQPGGEQAPVIVMMNPPAQELPAQPTASPSIPPYTPFASHTPTRTLLPPPTFEPPTLTPAPTQAPSLTLTPTPDTRSSVQGIIGFESPTPVTTPLGCKAREDWQLRYTVKFNDALVNIATLYQTTAEELALGNCLSDQNLIREGQILRVPGESLPPSPEVVCTPFEALTPFNDSQTVPGEGILTFNWRGPEAPRNLLRVTRPDGTVYEQLVELRQNATVDLIRDLPGQGRYTWIIRPLNFNFVQVCPDSPTWTFVKGAKPTATATWTDVPKPITAAFGSNPLTGIAPLVVQFLDQSQGEIVAYQWDFGDGTSSTQRDPQHTFTLPGTYIVTLVVRGADGTSSSSRTLLVVN